MLTPKKQIRKLPTDSIQKLQDHIAWKLKDRGFEDETLHERLLLLSEEVGELIKACRKITGMNVNMRAKIEYNPAEEIIDVINMVFSVGIKLGLNIEKEFLKKEREIDKRIYKRTKSTQS